MASANQVLLIGNLTRDPELRDTQGGSKVCGFGLAVNRKFKSGNSLKEEVCFVDITTWADLAENCARYIKKGSLVFVDGRLSFQSWDDNGKKRSKLEVVAKNVQFLDQPSTSAPPTVAALKFQDDLPF